MASVEGIHPKSQALELEAPLPGVMDALAALPSIQKARRFRSRVGHRLISLSRIGVFLLLLWVAGTADGPLDVVAGTLAVGLGIVLWFRSLLPRRFHAEGHPGDALDRRPELVRRVLLRLKDDLAPKTPVRLRLRPDPRPEGPGSSFYDLKLLSKAVSDVLDPWLTLETRLADGAHLRLSAVERRRNKVSDPGPNGPRRRKKTKEYDTLFLDARLRVKAKRHPRLAALSLDRAREAVRLPPGAKLQRLRITGERLRLRIRLEESWLPHVPKDAAAEASPAPDASRAVTMMLLSLYQVRHLARTPEAVKAPQREKAPQRRAKSRRRRSG
ncbi:hypothetical protein D7Y21_16300 [Corallococcus sp. AB045]|uniref:hypothetical protein n=1 Tax=Corallococcus sp. AB045 TaxID=2316719 RepID=UPI000ED5083F|nr:hypothetical protein [Corallococcus sp. AB045]RKH88112.1 hypothetical protein D7Y21_16300 [Corallococcus sp. AB045]